MTKKTIVAFVYDFDHTLSTTDRQNYSFIPSLDIKTGEFWSLANERTKKEKRDPLLAYRYLRLLESKKRNLPITREAFQNFGKDIQFFSGVEDWFPRINKYGQRIDDYAGDFLNSAHRFSLFDDTERIAWCGRSDLFPDSVFPIGNSSLLPFGQQKAEIQAGMADGCSIPGSGSLCFRACGSVAE